MKRNMQEEQLFEYAVIRVVPAVQREEFLNVGVVLYCRGERFLDMRYVLDVDKLKVLWPSLDLDDLHGYLLAFQHICHGHPEGGPIALLSPPERFRWLTAKRSTILQTSAVHPGLCRDAAGCLDRLFNDLVL